MLAITLNPTWVQQPEEANAHYAAFLAYCNATEIVTTTDICDSEVIGYHIPNENHWHRRYTDFCSDRAAALAPAIEKARQELTVLALQAAKQLLTARKEVTKTTGVTATGTIDTKKTRTILPNATVVIKLLEILNEEQDKQGFDYETLLRTMLDATKPPHPNEQLVVVPEAAQRSSSGQAVDEELESET